MNKELIEIKDINDENKTLTIYRVNGTDNIIITIHDGKRRAIEISGVEFFHHFEGEFPEIRFIGKND